MNLENFHVRIFDRESCGILILGMAEAGGGRVGEGAHAPPPPHDFGTSEGAAHPDFQSLDHPSNKQSFARFCLILVTKYFR